MVLDSANIRDEFIDSLAAEIPYDEDHYTLVAIDGVDGSGKTTFAAAFSNALESRGYTVLTIHTDDFLNLRAVRHRRGRDSPEGFWLDSYDYGALTRDVLAPFRRHGDGRYRSALTDHLQDLELSLPYIQAPHGTVCIVEGIFSHRRELAEVWDYSLSLDVPFSETARRMVVRDGTPSDPRHPGMRRYVEG